LVGVFLIAISAQTKSEDTKSVSKGRILYQLYQNLDGKNEFSLRAMDVEGANATTVKIPWRLYRMRATGVGTIIAVHEKGVVEFDRDAKLICEHKMPHDGPARATSAFKLASGNILAVLGGFIGTSTLVAEIDSNGKIVRKIGPDFGDKLATPAIAWPTKNDRLLLANWQRVFEIDWEGKKHFEYKLPNDTRMYDVVSLENGNVLISYDTTLLEKAKSGKVAEIGRDGKEVWSLKSHACPMYLQALSNGNVLIGGG
jgi:hypothetical protein